MPEQERGRGVSRYETVIATLVGVCALAVAAYTAYMQRQQVRAAVWPSLEFESVNYPDIHFNLANKGVGPAIIRQVVLTVDGQPVSDWIEAMQKLLGPGKHHFSNTSMTGRVLSPGELITVFTPIDDENRPLVADNANPLWTRLNKDRERVAIEICYSSSLGECWTLRSGATTGSRTVETRACPTGSAKTFQQ